MIHTPDLRSDPVTAACRKCRQPLGSRYEQDVLDRFGDFIRLQCSAFECGHIDWYEKRAITMAPGLRAGSQAASKEPGQVWVHDVMLEISFRADSAINREDSIEAVHS